MKKWHGNIHGDDGSIESGLALRNSSSNHLELNDSSSWPQSYRESMDMFKGITPASISFNGTSPFSDYQCNDDEASVLGKALLSETTLNEQLTISTFPDPLQRVSFHESIPSMKQCSFTQALVNGLLTTYAVKEGGWMSLTLLIIFGFVACYTGILLKRCLESSPGLHTYPDIGQAAFGVAGRFIIAVTLYAELYAACVEYVIIMSDNLSTIFPNTIIHIGGIYLNAHQIFAIIGILIVLPTVYLRDLSLLSYLSVGGVGASILVVLCLLWVGAVDQTGFHRAGTALTLQTYPFQLVYTVSAMQAILFFQIFILHERAFTFSTCTYTQLYILLVHLHWGSNLSLDSGMYAITLLPSLFTHFQDPEKMAIVFHQVIITISKYALTLTPIASSLEELVPSTWSRSYDVSILIRTALTISTLVVAMTIPFFAFLMALAGSLLTMLITIIFPCACYISILGGKLTNLQTGVCIFIGIAGILIACDGTYSALIRLAAGQS
ncbi:Eukaryotic aspartyl protease family protein [Hibiscus syriacus]|uniref:Eukaryotic aspartyl protease family protein n=1 Tax=Hibiscus syriacus TaxID=106335 RepID=A0A6A3BN61_HIBSY|nr:Eukaryotic aspartyl protease family protein [Hibiscus syriacus]